MSTPNISTDDLIKIIIALFIPPLAVFLKVGANKDFIINIIASILFFIPGVVHAIYIILKK